MAPNIGSMALLLLFFCPRCPAAHRVSEVLPSFFWFVGWSCGSIRRGDGLQAEWMPLISVRCVLPKFFNPKPHPKVGQTGYGFVAHRPSATQIIIRSSCSVRQTVFWGVGLLVPQIDRHCHSLACSTAHGTAVVRQGTLMTTMPRALRKDLYVSQHNQKVVPQAEDTEPATKHVPG